jgi:hypothetical protein
MKTTDFIAFMWKEFYEAYRDYVSLRRDLERTRSERKNTQKTVESLRKIVPAPRN